MAPRAEIIEEGPLRFFAGDALLVVAMDSRAHKIARVSFGGDGSIYVSFPYCTVKEGWIGELPMERGQVNRTYKLSEHGQNVSTDVKFSHHASGLALFSKTGVEIPHTRRQSFPLNGPIGHLFNLQVSRPELFTQLEKADKKAAHLLLDARGQAASTVSWRAEWRRKADIVRAIAPGASVVGPTTKIIHKQTGSVEQVVFLGLPTGLPLQDHLLMLTGGTSPNIGGVQGTGMAFLGAWDTHEVANTGDQANITGCLAFIYPAPTT